jgi:anti-anti-sigma factor
MEREEQEVRDGTLAIRVSGDNSDRRLSVSGELDLANAQTLEEHLKRAEDEAGVQITLDMSELEFIDSTGIAVLVAAHHRLAEAGGRLELVPSRASEVQRVLAITGLDAELSFAQDEDPTAG